MGTNRKLARSTVETWFIAILGFAAVVITAPWIDVLLVLAILFFECRLAFHSPWTVSWGVKAKVGLSLFLIILTVSLSLKSIAARFRGDTEPATKKDVYSAIAVAKTPPRPNVALVYDCSMISFPIDILANKSINLLPTNEKYILTKMGMSGVVTNNSKSKQFPSASTIKKLRKSDPSLAELGGWKCTVSNHGSVNATAVGIPLKVEFMKNGQPTVEMPFTAMLGPIDAGKDVIFYIANDCPIDTAIIMPDEAKVNIADSRTVMNFNLNHPRKNPVEPFMTFFSSPIKWMGGNQC